MEVTKSMAYILPPGHDGDNPNPSCVPVSTEPTAQRPVAPPAFLQIAPMDNLIDIHVPDSPEDEIPPEIKATEVKRTYTRRTRSLRSRISQYLDENEETVFNIMLVVVFVYTIGFGIFMILWHQEKTKQ